jgi:DNA-binding NarL/FixJ family response regulator
VKRIRVLVADDHPLFLAGVRASLAHAEDVDLVGEAHSGKDVLRLVDQLLPDLVLLDYSMPQPDGLACLETIRSRHPDVKVAILSGFQSQDLIEGALRRGASAFIVKSIAGDDLPSVVRLLWQGTVFQAHGVAEAEPVPAVELGGLTDRELVILKALARGLSNDAIAKELWIARHTVKFHVRNIYRKLGLSNRTEAARYAYQHGLTRNVADELADTIR